MRSKTRSKSRSKSRSDARSKRATSFRVNALDESGLEETPGRHDQPAEGGRSTVDQAIAAAASAFSATKSGGAARGRGRKSGASARAGRKSDTSRSGRSGGTRRKAA